LIRFPESRSHAPPERALNAEICGREQFIRRLFMAESCIASGRLDAATLILEHLAELIDRFHLEEWESASMVSHVWKLLRHCYKASSPLAETDERCVTLLRRICCLDPSAIGDADGVMAGSHVPLV
jgi:hypothetical protein